MGFMDRLDLWGPGTEHPQGFNQFLKSVEHLGCGAMELHAMHLKGKGALVARTLSYEDCNFEAVPNVMNGNIQAVYDQSASLWKNLNAFLADSLETSFGDDSDDEDEDLDDAALAQQEERRKHRDQLSCKPGVVKSRFWGAHQRFFRSLCIAAKVDKAIEIAQQALDDSRNSRVRSEKMCDVLKLELREAVALAEGRAATAAREGGGGDGGVGDSAGGGGDGTAGA